MRAELWAAGDVAMPHRPAVQRRPLRRHHCLGWQDSRRPDQRQTTVGAGQITERRKELHQILFLVVDWIHLNYYFSFIQLNLFLASFVSLVFQGRRNKDREAGVVRGIDFQFVSNVINFDFPSDVESYIHRVGRTARGNNKGTALSFIKASEKDLVEQVEAHLQDWIPTGQDSIFKYVSTGQQLDVDARFYLNLTAVCVHALLQRFH